MGTHSGVDYSFNPPDIAGLAARGMRFAGRYVGMGTSDKHLTDTERASLHGHGLSVVAFVEGTERGLSGGYRTGQTWAAAASSHLGQLDAPDTMPIYFACDFDVSGPEWPAVSSALRGAASVIGPDRVGLYGGINAITWAQRDRVAAWFMQTYAWSRGRWAAGVHIRQFHNGVSMAGGVVDLCQAMVDQYGQWAPAPVPPPQRWEDQLVGTLPTLRRGATGAPVRRVQGLLAAATIPATYDRGPVDGIDGQFGPATYAAVCRFQDMHRLVVDGVVGRHTWSALLGL